MTRALAIGALAAIGALGPAPLAADEALDEAAILSRPTPYRIESVRLSTMLMEQSGRGYQSADTSDPQARGSEELLVVEPILHVVAAQGPRLRHDLWLPVDVVSSASADAIDVTSSASRVTESTSIELDSTWEASHQTHISLHPVFHAEEQTRGWGVGLGIERSFADDNAVVSATVREMLDWVDRFELDGDRRPRDLRSTMNANVSFTQILSPTTIAGANYGLTLQTGELGNGWNSLPSAMGGRDLEEAPRRRWRHAFVGRIAQWLPWNGAVRAAYRLYLDDWAIRAQSAEVEIAQRFVPWLALAANARLHRQSEARFWVDRIAPGSDTPRSGDSDLEALRALTIGLRATVEAGRWRGDAGVERYSRSNGLRATIVTCSFGARF